MYDLNFLAKVTIRAVFIHQKARKGNAYEMQTQSTYAYTTFINIHDDISNTHIYEAPREVEINIHQCENRK